MQANHVGQQQEQAPPGGGYRYMVLEVEQDASETRARLLSLDGHRVVVAHLRDSWADACIEPGQAVNLLGKVESLSPGLFKAVCDFESGDDDACCLDFGPHAWLTVGMEFFAAPCLHRHSSGSHAWTSSCIPCMLHLTG